MNGMERENRVEKQKVSLLEKQVETTIISRKMTKTPGEQNGSRICTVEPVLSSLCLIMQIELYWLQSTSIVLESVRCKWPGGVLNFLQKVCKL